MSESPKKYHEKRFRVFDKFGGKCAYCGCVIDIKKFHVDHIKPMMRGMGINADRGTDTEDNMNPSCHSCNIDKGTLSLEDWRNKIVGKLEILNDYQPNYRICLRFGLIVEHYIGVVFYFEKLGE